jgi:CRP-like cAMP-binding protein
MYSKEFYNKLKSNRLLRYADVALLGANEMFGDGEVLGDRAREYTSVVSSISVTLWVISSVNYLKKVQNTGYL